MGLFRWRVRGRHALGAAVTSLPAGPLPAQPSAQPPRDAPGPDPAALPVTEPRGDLPRVRLGFRDGSDQSLDPSSEHALALGGLAEALTRRE